MVGKGKQEGASNTDVLLTISSSLYRGTVSVPLVPLRKAYKYRGAMTLHDTGGFTECN